MAQAPNKSLQSGARVALACVAVAALGLAGCGRGCVKTRRQANYSLSHSVRTRIARRSQPWEG